jgi:hypothetical protein
LIIWKELITLTKKEKKEIIFITDDRKEDWWTIENGKTIRPREELIKEFYDLTGIRILIYNADNFLHFAKERKLVTSIKEKSITEVKEVRKADEISISLSEWNDRNIELSKMMTSTVPSKWYDMNSRIANLIQDTRIIDRLNFNTPNLDTLRNISDRWNYETQNLDTLRKLGTASSNLDTLRSISERWNHEALNLDTIRKITETDHKLSNLYPTNLETIASKLPKDLKNSNETLTNNISKLETKTGKTRNNTTKIPNRTKKDNPNSDINK